MTSVFQLYGRPLAENEPLPPLRITGELEGYTSGEAYEGRLQIIDSIGKCVVEIVESDLPPGAYAFVDNFTKEIVLRWPAYTTPEVPSSGVHNGDFELGDDGSWRFGAGWSIEAGGAETGTYSAVYQNQRGIQSIESARVPYDGRVINASVRFQQGASSEGNLVGRILLIWCDAAGNMLPGGEGVSWTGGNLISSGSNGAWHISSVGASNSNAATVAIGFSANRKKQNKLCRVDNFTWDHTYSTGTNSDLDFNVTFKVTDSANRVAYWTGVVGEYTLFFTSQPYGVLVKDDMFSGSAITTGFGSLGQIEDEFTSIATMLDFELRLLQQEFTAETEGVDTTVDITAMELRDIQRLIFEEAEASQSASITAMEHKAILITTTADTERLFGSASIQGILIT